MRFLLPVFIVLMIAIAGCSDVVSPVGDSILPPQDGITVDSLELTAVSSATFRQSIIGVSSTLLLGRSEGLEGRVMMKFTGIPTNKQTAIIDSATLRLRVSYLFRDSIGTLALEIRKMLRTWSPSTFTWDSLNTAGTYNPAIDTTALFSITPQDSFIFIRIDPIVRGWFQSATAAPDGFAILPSVGSTIVGGISTLTTDTNYTPRLTISYHDTADTATLTLNPYAESSVSNGTVPTTPGLEFVQAGVSYRTKFTFDLSRIPAAASITSAKLTVHVDTLASLLNPWSRYQMLLHYATENATSPKLSVTSLSGNPVDSTRTTYVAEVRQFVQLWHTGTANYGVVFRASGESVTYDRYALFGATATDTLLRPRIKIIYSILP